MTRIPITLHTANALQWLGSLYRDAADALKEHVSNAIDEHEKAKSQGRAQAVCPVTFTIEKSRITVEYPYGMSRQEFRVAMERVADSAKKELDLSQIGQLGIGMFGFLQFAGRCVILSKKAVEQETIKATLRSGSDEAELETARKSEALSTPGIRLTISDLKVDPTKSRGPLSVRRLESFFSERYGSYLRNGSLRVVLMSEGCERVVKPPNIELPRIVSELGVCYLKGSRDKTFRLELYFDPSGLGTVGFRHRGVVVIDSIRSATAYGLNEESVYASGDVRGFVDADFLRPLPARTGFEENVDWVGLCDELDHLQGRVAAEVSELKREEAERKLTELQRQALDLAREILDADEFRDLDLLDGSRTRQTPRLPPNGFDFVPDSLRIGPGQKGRLVLKAYVPKLLPDGSIVRLSVSDPLRVRLLFDSGHLLESAADENGVVDLPVHLDAKTITDSPIVLTATSGKCTATARIRVAEATHTRSPRAPGETAGGLRLNYVERPFESIGQPASHHSCYVSGQVVVNDRHPHHRQHTHSQDKLKYAALMIGKETMAFNNKTANDSLEKMLSFYFELHNRMMGKTPSVVKRPRGRPRKIV